MAEGAVLNVMSHLNQCFMASSRVLPAEVDYAPFTTVISFSLLGQHWALPLHQISELIEMQDCTPLPWVKPWVLGVSNVRGKLLPVIDFAQFLGGQLSSLLRMQRIIVLDRQDVFVGLVVDEVQGVRRFSSETYDADIADLPAAFMPFVSGSYGADDGCRTLLLNPDALIENQLFQNIVL